MTRSIAAGVVLCLGLAGDSAGQQLSSAHRIALADTLQQFAVRIEKALQQADADSILALYGRPDEFVDIDDGELVPFERMAREVREYTRSVRSTRVRWLGRPTVLILNADAAVLYGTHRFDGGPDVPAHTGIWTGVLQRIDGQWRIVHAHGSDAAPGASGPG